MFPTSFLIWGLILLPRSRLGVDFTVALRNLEHDVPLQDLGMVTAGAALSRSWCKRRKLLTQSRKPSRKEIANGGEDKKPHSAEENAGLVMSGLPVFLIVVLLWSQRQWANYLARGGWVTRL
jgi:hypothetical protein